MLLHGEILLHDVISLQDATPCDKLNDLSYTLDSLGNNLYTLKYVSLEEDEKCLFNNEFNVRQRKVT